MIFSSNKEIGTTGAFDFGTRTQEIVKRSTTQKFLHNGEKNMQQWNVSVLYFAYVLMFTFNQRNYKFNTLYIENTDKRKAVRRKDSAENSAAKVNTEPDASSDEIIGAHISEASDSDDMEISLHEASESYLIDTCGLDEFTIEDENILGKRFVTFLVL